jgi:hypothetical protein
VKGFSPAVAGCFDGWGIVNKNPQSTATRRRVRGWVRVRVRGWSGGAGPRADPAPPASYLTGCPVIAREITSRWISLVPSKMV